MLLSLGKRSKLTKYILIPFIINTGHGHLLGLVLKNKLVAYQARKPKPHFVNAKFILSPYLPFNEACSRHIKPELQHHISLESRQAARFSGAESMTSRWPVAVNNYMWDIRNIYEIGIKASAISIKRKHTKDSEANEMKRGASRTGGAANERMCLITCTLPWFLPDIRNLAKPCLFKHGHFLGNFLCRGMFESIERKLSPLTWLLCLDSVQEHWCITVFTLVSARWDKG